MVNPEKVFGNSNRSVKSEKNRDSCGGPKVGPPRIECSRSGPSTTVPSQALGYCRLMKSMSKADSLVFHGVPVPSRLQSFENAYIMMEVGSR